MPDNQHDAQAIIDELQRLFNETESLVDDAGSGAHSQSDLKDRFSRLKRDIQDGAKYGTLSRKKQKLTQLEESFFAPTMRSALNNFHLKSNASPKDDEWESCLIDVGINFSHCIGLMNNRT